MSTKCPTCKKWIMEGESCKGCAKQAAEDQEKEAREEAADKARKMKEEIADRKAKLAAGEIIEKAEKTDIVSDAPSFTWKFDFKQNGLVDINKIDWNSAVGVQRSDAGSDGVFFVSFPEGAVCVKPSTTLAADVLCTHIAKKLGICTPDLRVVAISSEEGGCLLEKLSQLDNKRPTGQQTVSKSLSKTYVLVMQYIQGVDLEQVTYQEANNIFSTEEQKEGKTQMQQRCEEIGSVVAFDVLINNSDRLPCVWDNNGNAANVMFSSSFSVDSTYCVVGIDNCITAISPTKFKDNLDKYCQRVKTAVAEANELIDKDDSKAPEWCHKIQEMIERMTGLSNNGKGIDIGEAGCSALLKGFVGAIKLCASSGFLSGLTQVRTDIVEKYGSEIVGLDRIDVDFLNAVLNMF